MDEKTLLISIISASFVGLLAIIGWFSRETALSLKTGMEGLREEMHGLRADMTKYHEDELETRGNLRALEKTCEERHKRIDYEIAALRRERE